MRNWSTSVVRFNGGVLVDPLYPTLLKRSGDRTVYATIRAVGKEKTRVFLEFAAVLVFGHYSECWSLQKRWVSLYPSNFVDDWSIRAVRFNGRVSMNSLYPTYKSSSLGFCSFCRLGRAGMAKRRRDLQTVGMLRELRNVIG